MNGKDKKFIIKEKTTTARLKEDNKVKYRIKVVGGEEVTIKESDKDGTKMSKKVKIKMVKIKEGKDESSIDNASAKDVDVTYKIGHLFHYFETPEEIDGVKFEKPVELPVKGV